MKNSSNKSEKKQNKTWIIAKREYLKVVTKKSFWIATLFFPLFIVGVALISGLSSQDFENKLQEQTQNVNKILILDESDYLNEDIFQTPLESSSDKTESINSVKSGESEAFIYYPKNLKEEKIQIYTNDLGIINSSSFGDLAKNLVRQSILLEIKDPELIQLYNQELKTETISYKDGEQTEFKLESFIVPIASVVMYFMLVSFSTSYLLMSVSEEKENRVMESVISLVKPKELIIGKIFGQVSVVITQFTVLTSLAILGLKITQTSTPLDINFSEIAIDPLQIAISLLITMFGFFIIANFMVGAGSAMPNYKEAQSFSSIFIVLSICPMWFITLILAEPSGTLARVLSFTPLTAPLILVFRNALGELATWEIITGILGLSIQLVGSLWLAFKLFEIGSLQYHEKIDFKKIVARLNPTKEKTYK